jgi:hypothetical protein
MRMSPAGLRAEKDCAGEAQQQQKTTDPDLSSERVPHIKKPVNCVKIILKGNWSPLPDVLPDTKQTNRLTVGRNITLTLT